ncbi:super-infection exclusion protein B [Arsenophonus sp. aPb]|nr:super-infection exclusion protein B [Arsenophonus sp. aPb]WGL99128.1 super-infection exclusion protein B [Arsenophonus sp. aPb]
MPDWVMSVISFLKGKISVSFSMFWLMFGLILWIFLPESFFIYVDYRPILPNVSNSLLLIFFTGFFVSKLVKFSIIFFSTLRKKIKLAKEKKDSENLINNLSSKELNILYDAIIDGKRLFKFHNRSPSALRLIEKNILKYHGTIKDKPIMGWFEINKKYYQIILKKYADKINHR